MASGSSAGSTQHGRPAARTLTDLPPELLDHITSYLPTARSVANVATTSRRLNAFIEKDAWQTFARSRFPTLHPHISPGSGKAISRTLTSLSRAWDRRAFVSRYTEPWGEIHAFPGNKKVERWKRPRGQTIGFTPQLDCFEEIGNSWTDRREVLAFSAGAEVCVRKRKRRREGNGGEDVRWLTYRPLEAREGIDDITTLRLVRPSDESSEAQAVEVIIGTANGNLELIHLSEDQTEDVSKTSFATDGLPVRSSSLMQGYCQPALLAACLGETRVSLYPLDETDSAVEPTSSVELPRPTTGHSTYRAWSTSFLSSSNLAIGLGPSEDPIHIYELSPSGLHKDPVRKYSLQNDLDRLEGEITLSGFAKKSTSSVYPIVPLLPTTGSTAASGTSIFLSGAYDGIIRLHDLRSNREVEQAYIDPTDESAIYSLLPRGQEKLVAGTSRHTLLKVFDLRLGAKAYSYLDASPSRQGQHAPYQRAQSHQSRDWNLFLKPNSATYSGRGGGNNWSRRSAESSIYSLASSSAHSPHIYAGVENAVVEMAFTSVLDNSPDPSFFAKMGSKKSVVRGFRDKEVMDLAMYDQDAGLKLLTQMSLWETTRVQQMRTQGRFEQDRKAEGLFLPGLDERWKVGS